MAVLAQVLAPVIVIAVADLDRRWTGMAEDWLAPLVGVAVAFALEALALFLIFSRKTGLTRLLRWVFAVAGSWVAGLVVFVMLDTSLTHWAPRIGWAASTIALALLAWRLTKEAD